MRQHRLDRKHFNYAAVGITQDHKAADDGRTGGRVSEESVQVGSGPARWLHAWQQTMSWGIQRSAGYSILPVGEDATNQVRPGLTVRMRRRFGPLVMSMPVRVVHVIDEPDRKGFAFGTLSGHPVSGEVAFVVEHRPDDTVHFVLRTFSGPGKGPWALAYPVVLLLRGGLRDSYLESLAAPLD
ncbi:DUF1990 family protein [Propionibacteriaceae bacterium G57]|uniref:DUF1990 family protein n=1 Tax=Aestuariimicrobium sp. G57 TaxID=3418485 RepID=UPI003DA74DFF